MSNHTSANTSRYQDVDLELKGVTKMVNAGTDIPECAFIFRQEGAKKETTVIFIMGERARNLRLCMIKMEIGQTFEMRDL